MSGRPEYVGYIAMSLDGFIADADGGVGWLDDFDASDEAVAGESSYEKFIAGIDGLLMGRATFDQVMGWGWPYGEMRNYVLTREAGLTGAHITAAGTIETLRGAIEAGGHNRIWVVGGGVTQRIALDAGMFDSIQCFVMPRLLGTGLPLFAPGGLTKLTLVKAEARPSGVVEIRYTFKG